MTVRIILVRHGNTFEANEVPVMVGKTDLPLTNQGIEQAKTVGHYLREAGIQPKAFYSGNLLRQTESLRRIAQAMDLDLPLQKSEALNEINYGPWEGLTVDEASSSQWPEAYKAWTQAGIWQDELFQEPFDKRIQALKTLLASLWNNHVQDDTILCVSSQGIIRLFLYFIPELWQTLSNANAFSTYKVKTGHFCELSLNHDQLVVKRWNINPEQSNYLTHQ